MDTLPGIPRTLDKMRRGERATIVAYGDSNTAVTFHTRGHMSWVSLLEEALFEAYGANACILVNSSKCGASYRDGLERLDRDVLRFEPDLVILAFGMNDATRGLEALPTFRDTAREMIRRIRAVGAAEILIRTPNPVVTVHGLPLPEGHGPGKPYLSPRRPLQDYARALVELAETEACAVVDHYTLWCGKRFSVKHPVADPTGLWPRMGDAIHPGAIGHLAFFRELAPLFEVAPFFPWEEH